MDRRVRFGASALTAVSLLSIAAWYLWFRQPDASSDKVDAIKVVQRAADEQETPRMPSPVQASVGDPGSNQSMPDEKTGAGIPDDPSIEASLFDPTSDPRILYKRIRSERRDKDWADRSERGIQTALAAIPNIGRGDTLRVNCAATLCEVRGSVPEGTSFENTNVAMQALQGDRFNQPLRALDLQTYTASFGGGGKGMPFIFYIRRHQ